MQDILWRVDSVLGNDRKTSKETTAVTGQRTARQWTGYKAVFCTGSTPKAVHATVDTTVRSGLFYAVNAKGL
jgi:hypothetical protein